MAWWIAFVFQIQVTSCCVFQKKREKKWKNNEPWTQSLYIWLYHKAKRLCVYVRCCYQGQALSRTAIFYTSLLTFKMVSSRLFFIYIYKSIFKYIDFIFHPSCAICCVELSFIVSNHAINKETTIFLRLSEMGGEGNSCQLNCVHSLPVRLLI